MPMMVKLGDEVRDVISGLTGIAVSKIDYLNGCIQFGLQAKAMDGRIPEIEYVDLSQLQVITRRKKAEEVEEEEPPGGPPPSKKPPRM